MLALLCLCSAASLARVALGRSASVACLATPLTRLSRVYNSTARALGPLHTPDSAARPAARSTETPEGRPHTNRDPASRPRLAIWVSVVVSEPRPSTAPRPPQRRAAPPRRAPWCLPQRAGRRRRVLALLCLCSVAFLSMSWVSAFVQPIEASSPKQGYPEPESTYTPIHYFYVFSGS